MPGFLAALGSGIASLLPAILTGGATLQASGMNVNAEKEMMRENFAQNEKMFGMQQTENQRVFEQNKMYNAEIWEKEKAYAEEMWTKQNAYNSPAAQMQRMKEAGLNPNLMYGQGTTGNATAIPISKMASASVDAAKAETVRGQSTRPGDTLMKGVGDYIAIRNADLERRNMSAQNALIAEQIRETRARREQTEENTRSVRRENDLLDKTGASVRDPWWLRIGSRGLRWMEKDAQRMEKGLGYRPLEKRR